MFPGKVPDDKEEVMRLVLKIGLDKFRAAARKGK